MFLEGGEGNVEARMIWQKKSPRNLSGPLYVKLCKQREVYALTSFMLFGESVSLRQQPKPVK